MEEETLEHQTPAPALAPGVAPPERIEIDGLLLRRWTLDDAEVQCEAINESYEHLRAWMDWIPEPTTPERQWAWIELQGDAWPGDGGCFYGIFDAASGTMLGTIGAHDRLGPGALEIGYWCHVAHTGKGVITRAARELTRILLELDGIERVEIHCDAGNTRSAAVPQRLGYRLDRIEDREVNVPNGTGRGMVWIKEREPR